MGDEVSKHRFKERDYQQFQQKLNAETEYVRELFKDKKFDNHSRRIGYELELCLLDAAGAPAPLNKEVLTKADNELFTYELAKFNLEINGRAFDWKSSVFKQVEDDLEQLYGEVERAAHDIGIEVGLFGVLPSLHDQHLDVEQYMSDMFRYRLLNERLISMRQRPVHLEIRGEETLEKYKNDVMLEALGTSLQIHYQVPFDEAVDAYHASLWASMAVLGAAANSPLVFGRHCWQESRIAIFKQAVDTRNPQEIDDQETPRVHLSTGYIKSWLDLFDDNLRYSPILPEVLDCEPTQLHHFNLHNGTIWRWVRPILGHDSPGRYHLRLEMRVAPSGPTRIDSIANLVFHVGLLEGLKQSGQDLTKIPYPVLEKDFYKVARHGLDAEVGWCDGNVDSMKNLILDYALPVGRAGLSSLGIRGAERWLDVIEQRVRSGRNGSQWILQHWNRHADSNLLVRHYLKHSGKNQPVHLWPSP